MSATDEQLRFFKTRAERLKDERDQLRSNVAYQGSTIIMLTDENAKLRELVRWMYGRMDESCAVHHTYAPAPVSYEILMQALARLRELGIEASDAG